MHYLNIPRRVHVIRQLLFSASIIAATVFTINVQYNTHYPNVSNTVQMTFIAISLICAFGAFLYKDSIWVKRQENKVRRGQKRLRKLGRPGLHTTCLRVVKSAA